MCTRGLNLRQKSLLQNRRDGVKSERLGKVEALPLKAAALLYLLQLVSCLDSLRNRCHAELARQGGDGSNDRLAAGICNDLRNESPGNLYAIRWIAAQIVKGTISRTKIVDRQFDSMVPQPRQHRLKPPSRPSQLAPAQVVLPETAFR